MTFENGKYVLDGVDVTSVVDVVAPDFVMVKGRIGRKSYHAYFLEIEPGKWIALDGITTVLKVNSKENLIQWAADMAAAKALGIVEEYLAVQAIDDWRQKSKAKDALDEKYPAYYEARMAHRAAKEEAGERGTDLHALVEEYVGKCITENGGWAFGELPADLMSKYALIQKFVIWAHNNNVRFIASEQRMCSRTLRVAGTCDLVFEKDGKTFVGDVKTYKKIWDRIPFFQCAAYSMMWEEMHGANTVYESDRPVDGYCVLRLSKDGSFEPLWSYDVEGDRSGFTSALDMHRRLKEYEEIVVK